MAMGKRKRTRQPTMWVATTDFPTGESMLPFAHASADRSGNTCAVFTWVLECLSPTGLVKGKTIGIDATTLEASAALPSIVRRDSGESDEELSTTLANAQGSGTPTRARRTRHQHPAPAPGTSTRHQHPAPALGTRHPARHHGTRHPAPGT